MPKRKWNEAAVSEALAAYQQVGVSEASRRTGIPKGTIASLAHRNGLQTFAPANMAEAIQARRAQRQLQLEEIKDGFADLTLHMQDRARDEDKGTQAQAWTTSAAIAADKLLLMSGEATSRHETRGGELEREIKAQLDRLRERRQTQLPHHHLRPDRSLAIEAEVHDVEGEDPDDGANVQRAELGRGLETL